MKKRYFYILILFAIIPVLGWIIFNASTSEVKYDIGSESGDIKEFGNVKFQVYKQVGEYGVNSVSIGKDGVQVSKANYFHDYGPYKNIVENKDLLRGKTIYDEFIDENDKFCVYACIENGSLDLNIKNKESKKIVRTKDDVKDSKSTLQVRIIDNYVEVITEGYTAEKPNQRIDHLIKAYKFDLDSGKLLKESIVAKNLPDMNILKGQNGKSYFIYSIQNEIKEETHYMIIYDSIHDQLTKVNLPEEVKETLNSFSAFNNGILYMATQDGDTVFAINEQGQVIKKYKINVKEPVEQRMIVDDGKIYLMDMASDSERKQRIYVYSLESGKCLYSCKVDTSIFCYKAPEFEVK
ncbi:hypothetical protein [Inconstantimicrobium mannanitabidum]|uniref:Uncharacterized protein n=1 Tax=Inconstantimicrobium mannanitabidum TaxID=1604901 RepID=A0ACB5RGB9_9CLOT|nr:hypothetical protein [Clostridium sp. TW13]GKX68107.1 hypothetical protein rsdtw13_33650 [Clostridium sp. TW13]